MPPRDTFQQAAVFTEKTGRVPCARGMLERIAACAGALPPFFDPSPSLPAAGTQLCQASDAFFTSRRIYRRRGYGIFSRVFTTRRRLRQGEKTRRRRFADAASVFFCAFCMRRAPPLARKKGVTSPCRRDIIQEGNALHLCRAPQGGCIFPAAGVFSLLKKTARKNMRRHA